MFAPIVLITPVAWKAFLDRKRLKYKIKFWLKTIQPLQKLKTFFKRFEQYLVHHQ